MILTLSKLFDWYITTRDFNNLKLNSQIAYEQMMNKAEDIFGSESYVLSIDTKLVDRVYSTNPRLILMMRVMRKIWNVAIRQKLVISEAETSQLDVQLIYNLTENPFSSMGLQQENIREIRWTEDELLKFRSNYSFPTLTRILDIAYYLAQRPIDAMKMQYEDFDWENRIVIFIQQKTGTSLVLYIPDELMKYKILWSGSYDTIYNLNRDFKYVKDSLKLSPELQLRDLRRSRLTELANRGATDSELQAISGIKTRSILNRYQRSTWEQTKNAMNR